MTIRNSQVANFICVNDFKFNARKSQNKIRVHCIAFFLHPSSFLDLRCPAVIMLFGKSCLDLWLEQVQLPNIMTGSKRLDRAIDRHSGGGVSLRHITEFCGPPGCGKTQMCLQLCVNVQLPKRFGGLAGSAVFIDTVHGCSPQRLRDLATASVERLNQLTAKHGTTSGEQSATTVDPPSDESDETTSAHSIDRILQNIHCTSVSTIAELRAAIVHLHGMAPVCNVRLIVIDSMSNIFNHDRMPSADRVRIQHELLTDLDDLALANNGCAVVITNELTTRLVRGRSGRSGGGNNDGPVVDSYVVPAMGDTHRHRIAYEIALGREDSTNAMRGAQDEVATTFQNAGIVILANVRKSLTMPETTVPFKVRIFS